MPDDRMRARQALMFEARRHGGAPHRHGTIHDVGAPEFGDFTRERNLLLPGGWGLRALYGSTGKADRLWLTAGPAEDVHSAYQVILPAVSIRDAADVLNRLAIDRMRDVERRALRGEEMWTPPSTRDAWNRTLGAPLREAGIELPGEGWVFRVVAGQGGEGDRALLSVGPAEEPHAAYGIFLPADELGRAARFLEEIADDRQGAIARRVEKEEGRKRVRGDRSLASPVPGGAFQDQADRLPRSAR